jgi:hypothetical protein|tara:strand:+ start:20 stop:346 length:327 start_codon:yes stop_codon:yes gene_type:complete
MPLLKAYNSPGVYDPSDSVTVIGDRAERAIDVFTSIEKKTASEWEILNPALQIGELGLDLTHRNIKIGDGFTSWSELSFMTSVERDIIRTEYGNELDFIIYFESELGG